MKKSFILVLALLHGVGICAKQGMSGPKKYPRLFTNVRITPHTVKITINETLRKPYLTDNFEATYNPPVDLTKIPREIVLMPCLTNLISIVWASGNKYSIDVMDKEFYHALKRLKHILKLMYPKTKWNGELIPQKIVSHPLNPAVDPETHTALFYSGGLDSVVSSLRHADKKQLLISVWGNHDYPPDRTDLWNEAQERLSDFAELHGHDYAYVKSNFFYFLNRDYLDTKVSPEITSWRLDTVEGIGWAGLAAPILYAHGYSLIRIASSISWKFPARIASTPIVDSAIRFAGIRMHQDAFELDRIQKFKFLRDFCKKNNIPKPRLKVCNSTGGDNCHKCIKCLQTITEAMVAGENPRDYGFELDQKTLKERMAEKIANGEYSKRRIWHFWSIQKRIKERIDRGENVGKYLKWLVNTPINYKPEINWKKFFTKFPWYKRLPDKP